MSKVNYVGCNFGKVAQQMISDLYKEYKIPEENQVNLDDLHITIFKSAELFDFNSDEKNLLEALDFNEVEIDYWTPTGNQMILKVKSQFCNDIFESLQKIAKPVYDDYIPHITIARDLPVEVLNTLPERLTKVKLKYYPIITEVYSKVL